jgi:hypothetical protein
MRGDPDHQQDADRVETAERDAVDQAAFGRQQEKGEPNEQADDRSL